MAHYGDRDCSNCIFHDERCTSWDCKQISREDAERVYKAMPELLSAALKTKHSIMTIDELIDKIYEYVPKKKPNRKGDRE